MGFTVDVADSVSEARSHLARNRYHTLLLDLMLPEGSGFDVLDSLALDRTPTKLLLLQVTVLSGPWLITSPAPI